MLRLARTRRPRPVRPLLLVLGLLALLPALAAAGEAVTVDGVLHVRNGAEPAQGRETWSLSEIWRAGGEDDEEVFFGLITQVVVDDAGNIYLLDTQLSQVYVFSPAGELLKTLSRQGEGPGETNNPSDMLIMPDGSLGLVQTFPGKVVQIDLDGNPAGVFQPGNSDPTQGGFFVVIDVNSAGGNLVLGGMEISQSPEGQTRNNYLAAFDREGQETARYFERSYSWVWANMELNEANQEFPHFRRWDVGPDGRVYAAAARNRYVVEVYRPDGAVDRIIERAFESRRRDENEMRVVNEVQEATRNNFPAQMQVKIQVEDTEPDIRSLHVTQDGRLMVESSRGYRDQPEGIMTTLDVFDAEGNFDRQVAVACEGDGELDGLFFASDDRVVRVTGFRSALIGLQTNGAVSLEGEDAEAAPMEVVYYAVER